MRKNLQPAIAVLVIIVTFVLQIAHPALAADAPELSAAAPGEIVVKAPDGMPRSEVDRIADAAGCDVVGPIIYSPGYYLLVTKGTTRVSRVRTAGKVTRATATPPSPTVQEAVVKLQAAGLSASPNWARKPFQTPLRPAAVPDDQFYDLQRWHLEMIRMPNAWAIQPAVTIGTRPIVAAVIDTGFDVTHPDFTREDGSRNYVDPINLNDPSNPNADRNDVRHAPDDGHGTHVAGTIGAVTNNGVGVASVAGWNQGGMDVKLLPIKAVNDEFGFFLDDALIASLNYVSGADTPGSPPRAQVVNMSLGGFELIPPTPSPFDLAIAETQRRGVVIVAAKGNTPVDIGQFPGVRGTPADLPGVIAVSAVERNRRLTNYSTFGGPLAITAPGGAGLFQPLSEQVVSTWPLNGPSYAPVYPAPFGPGPEGGYMGVSGTSMAAPHVAGAIALLLSAGAVQSEVLEAMQTTAQPLPDDVPNFAGGNKYGAGLLDAYEALYLVAFTPTAIVAPAKQSNTFYKAVDVSLQLRNVDNLKRDPNATLQVVVRTATAPTSVVRTINVDKATIPSPPPGASRFTPVTVTVPNIALAPGRYVIESNIAGFPARVDQVFLTVEIRTQPAGRSLFSFPFVVPAETPGGPEASVFANAAFTLQHWNPFKDNGKGEYAKFFSTGTPQENDARFKISLRDLNITLPSEEAALLFDLTTPLVYDSTRPPGARESIAPVGLGFWLDIEKETVLNISGPTVNNPVAIRLFATGSGWNQVGAPFIFPVDWNAASVVVGSQSYTLQQAIDNNIVKSALVGYDYTRRDYVFFLAPLGQFVPFNGYWIKALQDCTLIVPPIPTTAQSVTRAALPPSPKGWRARLMASVAGDRDEQNYFGQVDGAQSGDDKFDVAKPPSGAGHAYVRFLQKNAAGRASAFAFDMRPAGAMREEWTAAVTTDRENAEVTLSWDGLGSAPRRSRFTLKDTVTGQKISLRGRSSYTYRSGEAGATRLFTLTLEPGQSGGALAITNVNVASGRAVNGLSVRFTTNQDADVSGIIKTLGGKTVARLGGSGRAAASSQASLRWDGRNANGEPIPFGPYIIELTARSADGQTAQVKRPVMHLR